MIAKHITHTLTRSTEVRNPRRMLESAAMLVKCILYSMTVYLSSDVGLLYMINELGLKNFLGKVLV